jgi:hypothetical protein
MKITYGQDALDQARRDRRRRSALARRWDNDLLVLHEHGFLVEFDPATYPAHLKPDWATHDSPSQLKRPFKYFDQLLQARCSMRPPADIESALDSITSRKTKRHTPRGKQPLLTKEAIRAARLVLGWQQVHLARAMGKSRPWVSMIEIGKRQVPHQDVERLRQALQL